MQRAVDRGSGGRRSNWHWHSLRDVAVQQQVKTRWIIISDSTFTARRALPLLNQNVMTSLGGAGGNGVRPANADHAGAHPRVPAQHRARYNHLLGTAGNDQSGRPAACDNPLLARADSPQHPLQDPPLSRRLGRVELGGTLSNARSRAPLIRRLGQHPAVPAQVTTVVCERRHFLALSDEISFRNRVSTRGRGWIWLDLN